MKDSVDAYDPSVREQRSLWRVRHLLGVAVVLAAVSSSACSNGDEPPNEARSTPSSTAGPTTTKPRAPSTTDTDTTSTTRADPSNDGPALEDSAPGEGSVAQSEPQSPADVSGAGDAMPEGTNFGFLVGVNVAEATIAVDVAELLAGDEAVVAAVEDGAIDPAAPAVDNDYYIRNRNPKVRTVKVDRFAPIKVIRSAGEPDLVGTSLGGLAEEYARTVALGTEASMPVQVVVTAGVVTRIDQMFFP